MRWPGVELVTCWSQVQFPNHYSSGQLHFPSSLILLTLESLNFTCNNNNNTQDDIYSAVIMTTRSLREFTRFIWWIAEQHTSGRRPSDQATWLGLWVCYRLPFIIITQPESWYSFISIVTQPLTKSVIAPSHSILVDQVKQCITDGLESARWGEGWCPSYHVTECYSSQCR